MRILYTISFTWDDQGGYLFDNPDDHDIWLTLNNEFGEKDELKQFHPRKVYETLGVFIAPDGSQEYQFNKIKKKSTTWSDKIQTGHLPAQGDWKFLSSNIPLKK